MKFLLPLTSGLTSLGVIALASFVAVRILAGESGAHEPVQDDEPRPLDELDSVLVADAAQPRFVGDVEGIFITSSQEAVPAEYRMPECLSQEQVKVPWDQAGQLALDVQLPPQFIFRPEDMNTGVIACEGPGPYAARWAYELPLPQYVDYPGRVIIARGLSRWVYLDASTDRVKTIEAGGRRAVLIEPVRPEGAGALGHNGTQGAVVFPETFGSTSVSSIGVPLSGLLEIAELVGSATKY